MSYSLSFSATSKTAARAKMLELETKNESIPAGMSQLIRDGIRNLEVKDGQIIVVRASGYGAANYMSTGAKNEMTVEAL